MLRSAKLREIGNWFAPGLPLKTSASSARAIELAARRNMTSAAFRVGSATSRERRGTLTAIVVRNSVGSLSTDRRFCGAGPKGGSGGGARGGAPGGGGGAGGGNGYGAAW